MIAQPSGLPRDPRDTGWIAGVISEQLAEVRWRAFRLAEALGHPVALTAKAIREASRELAKAAKLHKQQAAKAREELEAELAKMPPPFRPPEVRRSRKPPKMPTSFATRKTCRHPSKRRAFRS